ncbi:PIN domain-containing protein [Pseudomonas quasicaspiana]|uniref:PIN domain-containing protein n=1 Tax=Pseudomonas quasicaspiana TaxID=2829821 RepID=UPI001E53F2A3|nr:PIN domain-containing protein [Pseudomonas quasicaspiana]MCD5976747.1 DUF4935 domain-containing protein [Pseudomonas quasicaspiana]
MAVYVFLDSNIYCSDYFARSGAFKYLIRYLNNVGATLILPQVVLEEVKNARDRSIAEELQVIEKAKQALGRFSQAKLESYLPELGGYDLVKLMESQVDSVAVVPYTGIDHAEIFSRALKVKRPFKTGEKGYRDTLLWLSLLTFFRLKSDPSEVVFINSNKHDFYAEKSIAFHADLVEDLNAVPWVEFSPYSSISDFVDTIDKVEHAFDHANDIGIFEDYVEDEAVEYLQSMDATVLQLLDFFLAGGVGLLQQATDLNANISEGVEDYRIESVSGYDDEKVYVSFLHDLRIFILEVSVPLAAYEMHKTSLRQNRYLYEVDELSGEVVLRFCMRPSFKANFIYDIKNETCSGYGGEILGIR